MAKNIVTRDGGNTPTEPQPAPVKPAPVDPDLERVRRQTEEQALRTHRTALSSPILRKQYPSQWFRPDGYHITPEIDALEKIYDLQGNQDLPLTWWLEQTVEDMQLLASNPDSDELLRTLYINAEAFGRDTQSPRSLYMDAVTATPETALQAYDTQPVDTITLADQTIASTLSLAGKALAPLKPITQPVFRALGWVLGRASWGVVKLLDIAAGIYSYIDPYQHIRFPYEDQTRSRWTQISDKVNQLYQEEAQQAYQYYLQGLGIEDPDHYQLLSDIARIVDTDPNATPTTVQRYMEENHPTKWQNLVKAYGLGDPHTAAQILWEELQDTPTRTELKNLGQQLDEVEREFLRDLDEVGPGERVLSVLSWYGRNVPGRLATYLFLFGRDLEDTALSALEGELHLPDLTKYEEEAAKHQYRPSSVIGLEDTLVGIGVDLFSMTMTDPVTWLFAPAKAGSVAKQVQGNAKWLSARAKSPAGVRLAHELIENIRYPQRGSITYAALLDDFAELGYREDLIEVALGGVNQATLQRARETRALYAPKPWKQTAPKAFELPPEKLDELFDGNLLTRLTKPAAPAEEAKTHPLIRRGIKRPLNLHLTRGEDGQLMLSFTDFDKLDELRSLGFPRIPVEIKPLAEAGDKTNKTLRLDTPASKFFDMFGVSAEEVSLYGKSRIPRAALLGEVDDEAVTNLVERALLAGARFDGPNKVLRSMSFSDEAYRAAQDPAVSPAEYASLFHRWMTPENTTVTYRLTSVRTNQQIRHSIIRLYGHDPEQLEYWLNRFDDMVQTRRRRLLPLEHQWQKYQALRRRLTELEQRGLAGEIKLVTRKNASGLAAAQADDAARTLVDNWKTQLDQVRSELKALEEELLRLRPESDAKIPGTLADYHRFLTEVWEDFNRRYIAPTGRYPVDPDTGLVPWEELRFGPPAKTPPQPVRRRMIPDELVDAASAIYGQNRDDLAKQMTLINYAGSNLHTTAEKWSWTAPLSVLDMLAATTPSRAKAIAWSKKAYTESTRQQMWNLMRLWVLDKIARPATALVVSNDELLRFFNSTGWEGLKTWVKDKALRIEASAKALKAPTPVELSGTPLSRLLYRLSPTRTRFEDDSWKASRLQNLQEYSSVLKEAERQVYEMIGDAPWAVLRPGDPGFLEAAERWTTIWYADEGFQYVILDDFDGFKTWFETHTNAHSWRRVYEPHILDGEYTLQDVWDSWRWFYDHVLLSGSAKAGRKADAHKAWVRTVERVRQAKSAEHITLPGWVLHDLPAVYGTQRIVQGAPLLQQWTNKIFDALFMAPTNYRRGLFSSVLYKNERERLMSLYAGRGFEVVSNNEWHTRLVQAGITVDPITDPGYTQMWALMEQTRAVPISFVEQLARKHADDIVEDLMFKWHRSTRLGRTLAAKSFVPFGGPWAEMAGWWARHIATPPIRRGYLANTKKLAFLENLPFNPQAVAFLSRLSATDVSAERGIIGEGFFQVDVGPAFFLPTASEEPFSTLLPSWGPLPSILVPYIVEVMFDPVEDPSEYRATMEELAKLAPALEFGTTEILPALIGGGWFSTMGRLASSTTGILYGQRTLWLDRLIGDTTGELSTSLRAKALLSEPGVIEDLIKQDFEGAELAFHELLATAYLQGGLSQAASRIIRQLIPVRTRILNDREEIAEVWVRLGKEHAPQLLPSGWETRYGDTPEDKEELANEIREAFFSLPSVEQEKLIVKYPGLAVNLIPGWEWTEKAHEEMPELASIPYRVRPGTEGLDLHRNLQKGFYIAPIDPARVSILALGRYFEARDRVGRALYENIATRINELKWTTVSRRTRQKITWMFQNYGEQLGVRTEEELYIRWNSLTDHMATLLSKDYGVDETQLKLTLPTKDQPWGVDWRGLDDEEFSKRFKQLNLASLLPYLDQETFELAQLVGIDLEETTTGEQLVNGIQTFMGNSWTDFPLLGIVQPQYQAWKQARSTPAQYAEEFFRRAASAETLSDEWKEQAQEFLFEIARDQYYQEAHGNITPRRIQLVREKFNQLVTSSSDVITVDRWKTLWDNAYSRMYGSFTWTPPTPPNIEETPSDRIELVTEVHAVPDGDTLYVRTTGHEIFSVRLLGVDAPELGAEEGAEEIRQRLVDRIMEAVREGQDLFLVTDPEATGRRTVDPYGRRLAWLFFDTEPYYFPEEIRP